MNIKDLLSRDAECLMWVLIISAVFLQLSLISGLAGVNSELFIGVSIVAWAWHFGGLLFCSVSFLFSLRSSLCSSLGGSAWVGSVVCLFALSSMPPVYRDALIHHLYVPVQWLRTDMLGAIWWHPWSHYPQLINVAFVLPLKYGYEQGPAVFHASYLVFLSLGVYQSLYATTKCKNWAVAGALLILLNPAAFRHACYPIVDIALAAYAFWGLWLAQLALEHANPRYYLACGVTLGAMCAIKPNGYLAAVLISSVSMGLGIKRLHRRVWLLGLGGLFMVVPWWVRGWYTIGNPVFPFMQSFFKGGDFPEGPHLNPLLHRIEIYGESVYQVALLPLRIFIEGQWHNPAAFDGILLFTFAIALFPWSSFLRSRGLLVHYLYLLGYWAVSFLVARARVRYLAPTFGTLSLLTLIMCHRWSVSGNRLCRIVGALVVLVGLAQSLLGLSDFLVDRRVSDYLSGQSTAEYRRALVGESSMIAALKDNLPENSLTYLLYTGNFYYLYPTQVLSGGHYSEALLHKWIAQAQDLRGLLDILKLQNVSHLLVHVPRYRRAFGVGLTTEKQHLWDDFSRICLKPLKSYGPFSLYKIGEHN